MGNQWYQQSADDDDDDDDGQNQNQNQNNKGLRAHVSKIEKENKELRTANEKLQGQVRQTTIAQVLADKGHNLKIAKLVPSDVEPTSEAVTKWLEDNAELFPAKPATGEDNSSEGGTTETTEGAEGNTGQSGDRISSAVNGATAPTKQADLMSALVAKDLTQEKLIDMIHAAGGGAGVG